MNGSSQTAPPPMLATAFVTGIGATLAPAIVAYAKAKGLDLTSPAAEQALAGAVTVVIGTGTGWCLAILNSFVSAVVAVNDAIASRMTQAIGKVAVVAAPPNPASAAAGFSRLGFLLLLSAVSLVGCATAEALFGSARILKDPPAQCVTVTKGADGKEVKTVNQICFDAAEAIAQANALLAAVDRTTLSNLRAGIWTQAEAQRYYDQTGKLGARVDQANTVFGTKNFAEALTSANATKQVILILQKEVAAQARK